MPGQDLCLGTASDDCTTTYVVEPNDDCDKVAHAHKIDLGVLRHNNPQLDGKCDNMYIGEVCLLGWFTGWEILPAVGTLCGFYGCSTTTPQWYADSGYLDTYHSMGIQANARTVAMVRLLSSALRQCLDGVSYPLNSKFFLVGWPLVESCHSLGAGGLIFLTLWWYQEHFITVMQFDVIDTPVEMELVIGYR